MARQRTTEPLGSTVVNHRFQTWGFIFLFGLMIPTLAVQSYVSPDRDGGLLGVVAVLTAPVAWWLLREARFRIVVSERGISARSFRAHRIELPWNEVAEVRYSPRTRVLEIRSGPEQERAIRVSLLRENVEVAARLLARKVPPTAFDEAARALFRGPR
jgi:hypothetical protein